MTRQIVTDEIRARIIALAREGKNNREIESIMAVPGLLASYIASIITKARRDGAILPYRYRGWADRREIQDAHLATLTITVDVKSADYLRRVGDRRGVTPDYVASSLIEVVARDELADAVLDDGVSS